MKIFLTGRPGSGKSTVLMKVIGRFPDFERVALPALSFALKECDITCVDELGKMEFFSTKFRQKVDEILRSGRPVIAVVHRNYAKIYERIGTLFQVTPENREEIVSTVVSKVLREELQRVR